MIKKMAMGRSWGEISHEMLYGFFLIGFETNFIEKST